MTTSEPLPLWAELLHEYYGVYLTQGRVSLWLAELRRSTQDGGTGPGTSDDELCRAVRFYRAKSDKNASEDTRRKKEATLDDLIMWVRWMRKEDRERRGSPGSEDGACSACLDGWVTAYRTLPEDPTLDDYYAGGSPCGVPCTCDRGRHWMQTCKDYVGISEDHRQGLIALAQLGARQELRRRELAEKETPI